MNPPESESNCRSEREKAAYDKGNVFALSDFYHRRFQVFQYPNTEHHEQLFSRLMERCARHARVLEIGCGDGTESERLFQFGASYVLGIDISEKAIAEARRREIPGKLEFLCQNISNPISSHFDLILGRAILHHVDYRRVLTTLYERNLVQGGTLLFTEPLGENIIMRAFYSISRNAHTPDERPFMYEDLLWLQSHFPGAQIFPFNYTSLMSGLVLSILGIKVKDNVIMQASDRIDRWLARNAAFVGYRFRQFILVIKKPSQDLQRTLGNRTELRMQREVNHTNKHKMRFSQPILRRLGGFPCERVDAPVSPSRSCFAVARCTDGIDVIVQSGNSHGS